MSQEIERKFLVSGTSWRDALRGKKIRQGYLCLDPERTVRVRHSGDSGKLTIKGKTTGISRAEFEYDIPADEADELLNLCVGSLIEKTRYVVEYAGKTWEVDVFEGQNSGLVMAEIELTFEEETFIKPPWIGEEVSTDKRYFNAYLSQNPFQSWSVKT